MNDRRIDEETGERRRFSSKILAPWCRKSPKISEVLPLLYLHGLSSGDFVPALEQFLGSAAGLSPATVTRLTKQWSDDHATFQERDLSDRDFVYVWADGVHPKVRPGQAHSCVLVLLGVRLDGTKELIALARAFDDFPAGHWIHLRTTNPIESAFSIVKLRTKVTRGAGSPAAALAMVFELVESAQARWCAITEAHLVALVRAGARFENGHLVEHSAHCQRSTPYRPHCVGRGVAHSGGRRHRTRTRGPADSVPVRALHTRTVRTDHPNFATGGSTNYNKTHRRQLRSSTGIDDCSRCGGRGRWRKRERRSLMAILGDGQGYSAPHLIKTSSEWGGSASGRRSMGRGRPLVQCPGVLWPSGQGVSQRTLSFRLPCRRTSS
ncbi:hypothetical protein GCM10010129_76920 [Streptomyces fumigatiscleroticus]|nr:hypothetical protein GCM10010129_76920 [Streptomyces fumigatiscleroticus]